MKRGVVFAVAVAFVLASRGYCQAQSEIPDEVLKNFRYFVGSWKTESKLGDVASEGSWTARWGKG